MPILTGGNKTSTGFSAIDGYVVCLEGLKDISVCIQGSAISQDPLMFLQESIQTAQANTLRVSCWAMLQFDCTAWTIRLKRQRTNALRNRAGDGGVVLTV
jgi:hypothetical protein